MYALLATLLGVFLFAANAYDVMHTSGKDCPETVMFYNDEEAERYARETVTVNGNQVFLTTAANTLGAACLDGTVPDFYWRPGSGSGVNKFHVFIQGGGWCGGVNTQLSSCQDTCVHRAGTNLGSSSFDGKSMNYDNGYMSTNAGVNPLAYNWNTVFLRYCDGFSFSGNNDTIIRAGKVNLHFRGYRILVGLFDELTRNYKLGMATDFLLSGCSAGGLSTYLHADFIRQAYLPSAATYLAMPDSGFFLYWEGNGQYITAMQWIHEYGNVTAALNPGCLASMSADDQYKCMFAQFTSPHIKSNLFPLQSRFDSWQTGCELQSDNANDINGYGANLTTNFQNLEVNCNGCEQIHAAFLDSCHHHCGEWNAITIGGQTSSQAQVQWYYKNNTHNRLWFQEDAYPCDDCC